MKIKLNGQDKEFENNEHLSSIVYQFCRDTKHVVAEVNGEIVKSANWQETSLKDGDSVELVNFVGGG